MSEKRQKSRNQSNSNAQEHGETEKECKRGSEARTASGQTENPAFTMNLMEEVLEKENLKRAYQRVVQNRGAAGVDKLTVDDLQPYLGAWGHMLAASADLIDMIHGHPAFGEGGGTIQFNVIFPRAGNYKLWVQFQRLGVVNTVEFNVPVSVLQ